jgi:hypothetical protein
MQLDTMYKAKERRVGKKEGKLLLIADEIIIHLENS